MTMVLLSFDIEEFDMPFEYNRVLSFDDQIRISAEGTTIILNLLDTNKLKATFFSTVIFAKHAPEIIRRIVNEGHELASHGYYHSHFRNEHLLESRLCLEKISGTKVTGYRMARMMPVEGQEISKAGYKYNSSVNPIWLPGRYNNWSVSRTYFMKEKVLQLPASVTATFRFPLFWLSFHNLPLWFYKYLIRNTYEKDGYVNLYFHPWEFIALKDQKHFGLPLYVIRNSGSKMIQRMDNFMKWINSQGYQSSTMNDFAISILSTTSPTAYEK